MTQSQWHLKTVGHAVIVWDLTRGLHKTRVVSHAQQASGDRRQSSSGLEHREVTPQDTTRPVLHERGAKIGDTVIESV